MKKLIVILALFALSFPLVCQTEDLAEQKTETEQINPKTGFPEIQHKPFVVFNEGAPLAKVVSLSCREKIIRIKSLVKNDEMNKIAEIENLLDEEFSSLERIYQVTEAVV